MANENKNLEQRLEDVAKAGQGYMNINKIFDQYKKDPSNPEIFNAFVKYGGEQLPEEEVKLLRSDIYKTRGLMERCLEDDQKALINSTANNVSGIISKFSGKELYGLAVSIPDKDKEYIKVKQALDKSEKDSIEQARKAYAETFDNKIWRKFIEEEADEDFVMAYASRYVQIKQRQFLNKFSSEKEVDGKKKLVLDENKLRIYVLEQFSKYEDKEKDPVYLQLGQMYTHMELKKSQEAAEKESENKDKKKAA